MLSRRAATAMSSSTTATSAVLSATRGLHGLKGTTTTTSTSINTSSANAAAFAAAMNIHQQQRCASSNTGPSGNDGVSDQTDKGAVAASHDDTKKEDRETQQNHEQAAAVAAASFALGQTASEAATAVASSAAAAAVHEAQMHQEKLKSELEGEQSVASRRTKAETHEKSQEGRLGQAAHDSLRKFFEENPGSAFPDAVLRRDGCDNVEPAYLKREHVREAFRISVKARSVGNNQLRKFLRFMNDSDWQMALDAAEGAQEAGLRLDAETCEMLLSLLLRAGQLRPAMDLYQVMVKRRISPHTKSYNHLIELAVDKKSPYAAKTLYNDMVRKGRSPDSETYELLMRAYALERPPQWEEAVEIFDKLQAKRNHRLSSSTYNALMTVYLNMQPFDYRIVYNAYYEMRWTQPKIRFGWDSYSLAAEALKRGRAPISQRIALRLDAWSQIVNMKSPEFWMVVMVGLVVFSSVRWLVVKLLFFSMEGGKGESVLDEK